MNERIRELIEQANAKELGADLYGGEFIGAIRLDFLEKFAELIVAECMNMCDAEKADYDKCRKGAWDFDEKNIYSEGAAACDTIKYKMKHRFGVK